MEKASANHSEKELVEALLDFQCNKDLDVQEFLNNKAIDFEKRGWATTYLLLAEKEFARGIIKIEGYFSLTHKAVLFNPEVSLSLRKKITGVKKATIESFVLIGQLGKRMGYDSENNYEESAINAEEIIDDAVAVIQMSSKYIINRYVIVECKPISKVKQIYTDYGFLDLQYNKNEELHTLYLKLNNNI